MDPMGYASTTCNRIDFAKNDSNIAQIMVERWIIIGASDHPWSQLVYPASQLYLADGEVGQPTEAW